MNNNEFFSYKVKNDPFACFLALLNLTSTGDCQCHIPQENVQCQITWRDVESLQHQCHDEQSIETAQEPTAVLLYM